MQGAHNLKWVANSDNLKYKTSHRQLSNLLPEEIHLEIHVEVGTHPLSGGGGSRSTTCAMHQSLSARVDTTDNGKSKDKEKVSKINTRGDTRSPPVTGDQNAVQAKLSAANSFPPLLPGWLLSIFPSDIYCSK